MTGHESPLPRATTEAAELKVAVIGAGIMGRGIARVFADAGCDVRLQDVDDDTLAASFGTLTRDLERSLSRGAIDEATVRSTLAAVTRMTSLEDAAADADLVIEAVPERLDLKREIFARLDQVARHDAVLATNTSALSVTKIASAAGNPGRVIGLHFFNPVHRMTLVEIVVAMQTDETTIARAEAMCSAAGKSTVRVADRPGFATSRINAMIGNEAFYMLMEGVASADDIDRALKQGLHHPMGPFELVDLVGLDTRLSVLQRLHESLGDKFRPCPLLVTYVEAGRLGRKTMHGVFRYDEAGKRLS